MRNRRAMRSRGYTVHRSSALLIAVFAVTVIEPAKAGLIYSGDVTPVPTNWTSSTTSYVGRDLDGEFTLKDHSTLSSGVTYVGSSSAATGRVYITSGATWSLAQSLTLGTSGKGHLEVETGGRVQSGFLTVGGGLNSTGTATIRGSASSLAASQNLAVGGWGTGTLLVEEGATVTSTNGLLGQSVSGVGLATVKGSGSSWTVGNSLQVGVSGTGRLTVSDGGIVVAPTIYAALSDLQGNGEINVRGAVLDGAALAFDGSSVTQLGFGNGGVLQVNADETGRLGAGYRSNGTLTIRNGATVESHYGVLGSGAASHGSAVISGEGTSWTLTKDLLVGAGGRGTLQVESGAVLHAREYVSIGDTAGANGSVVVSGQGSKLLGNYGIRVGYYGSGSLRLENGAYSGGSIQAGVYSGSVGVVTITGRDTTANSSLNVGSSGQGTVTISDGARVSGIEGFVAQYGGTGSVLLTGAGSQWTVRDGLHVYNRGSVRVENGASLKAGYGGSAGTLIVTGQGSVMDAGDFGFGGTFLLSDGAQLKGRSVRFSGTASNPSTIRGASTSVDINGAVQVGESAAGVLRVENGASVRSISTALSLYENSSGTVILTGAGTTWVNEKTYRVGQVAGTLTVSDGAVLQTGTLIASPNDLKGNGTIIAGAVLLDTDVVFDRTRPVGHEMSFGTGGKLRLDIDGANLMGAGYKSTGSLTIKDGVVINSSEGWLGYAASANGKAIVKGPGSAWNNAGELYVGRLVTWGVSSRGSLTVADGAQVSASRVNLAANSPLDIYVTRDRMLILGTPDRMGEMNNSGKIGMFSHAFLAPGVYRPIADLLERNMIWNGSTSVEGIGGSWTLAARSIVLVEPTAVAAETPVTVASNSRIIITDAPSGERLGLSFGSVPAGSTFAASMLAQEILQTIPTEAEVIAGWGLQTSLSQGRILLAWDIGTGWDELALWRYSGGAWSLHSGSDLYHNSDGVVNVLVSDFSGYALVGVPEPCIVMMLAGMGLLLGSRRRRSPLVLAKSM